MAGPFELKKKPEEEAPPKLGAEAAKSRQLSAVPVVQEAKAVIKGEQERLFDGAQNLARVVKGAKGLPEQIQEAVDLVANNKKNIQSVRAMFEGKRVE